MKFFHYILAIFCLLPLSVSGQSYKSLWKQVEEASKKDLPKSEMEKLSLIIDKASREKSYGHLLKASLRNTQVMCALTPDSISGQVARLERMEQEARAKDPVLAAVWNTVLGCLYRDNYQLGRSKAEPYFKAALQQPELLARHKVSEYQQLIENGYDGRWFDNDLLSVIGYEAKDYAVLHNYYRNTSLRTAACLTACEMVRSGHWNGGKYLPSSERRRLVDSLLTVYGDIKVAGELAVYRYSLMDSSDEGLEDRVNFINYAVSKWGSWPRINILRNNLKKITQPYFHVYFGNEWNLPSKSKKMTGMTLRNVQEITMTVTRLSLDASRDYDLRPDKDLALVKAAMMPLNQIQQKRRYDGQPAYKTVEDSLEIPELPVGMYLVELQTDNKNIPVERGLYYVSDVQVLAMGLPQNTTRYVVVSATTGQPLPGAHLRLNVYDRTNKEGNYHETVELTCDEKGEARYVAPNNIKQVEKVFAYTETDRFCPEEAVYTTFRNYNSQQSRDVYNLYTDRSIYRPGQKVHVAVIAYYHDGKLTTTSLENQSVTVTLSDANRKVVDQKEVVTDAFGKAATEFDLPENGLTGLFTVEVNGTRKGFRVEQYKRPTYEVTFPEIHETYQAGDTVVVKGRAMMYSGVPVQDAKVKYVVTRQNAWWWGGSRGRGTTLLEGNATTDSDGYFSVDMPMVLPEGATRSYSFYTITAVADVTDTGGETHSAEISLPLGSRSTVLACNLPQRTERDSLKTVRFDYKNMAGADVDGVVTYYINNSPKAYTAPTNKVVPVGFDPNTLGSGKHLLTAICGNDTIKCHFVMFSLDDKTPCEETDDWFYVSDSHFSADGKPVYVQVGSSNSDTHVLYTVVSGETVLEEGSFDLNNSILTRPFTYQSSYGNGIVVTYAWVKEGKTYTHQVSLLRPLPDKRLKLEWATFRDRLQPGQKEQWTLKVTRPDGTPAPAQLLATMYDKSLDQVYSHGWAFEPTFYLPLPTMRWNFMSHNSYGMGAEEPYKLLNEPALLLNHFYESLFSVDSYYIRDWSDNGRRGPIRMKSARVEAMNGEMAEMQALKAEMVMDEKPMDSNTTADQEEAPAAPGAKGEKVSLRENLSETAFFLPDLVADQKGNVVMKFTLPESVTTWKMMALATDQEMNHGQITAEAVAQKDVMVQPNVPRFLRINDIATLPARVFNNTDKTINGVATLALLDPETMKTVYKQNKNYRLDPGQGSSVLFDVKADGKLPLYVCRVTVSGKGYSDGEQHYLPVLPDHEMVLRTYPFTQHGPGRMAVKLDQLFAEGIKDGKLTVEYTNNPAWLVVQTMPSLATLVSDDVVSQASAYYANTIGSYIMGLSPAIRENVMKWQQEADNGSLTSPLEKNQELKDLVLSETPWVRVAESETAQKRDLALYFDEALLSSRLQAALYKMKKLQNSDGSWSWWPGMSGSAYMTVSVTQTLVRLNHMIGNQQNTAPMVKSAFDFLGKYLVEEMKETKKEAKNNKHVRPSETALQIMYIFALDGRKLPSAVNDAQKYFIGLLRDKATEFTIYGKATAAVIFAANKEKQLADEFVESISQYSVMTEEAGRYFDTRRAYYSWCDYKIPTEVAAIEAFKAVRPNDLQTVEEMQRWLLHEKRGHSWNTYINTVNAAYAFLDGNLQALDNGEQTRFTLNGKNIHIDGATAGLGYVKTTVPANGSQAFAAEKTSQGTSWGALYAQFDQKSTEVTASASEISVKREIVGNPAELKVGDRIRVRITMKAERDLDFVQVVDRRAACMEPVSQLSGYRNGCYCAPQDNQTCYYFDRMPKGTHVIETEYYIDRAGTYDTGTCKAQCAYAPEYVGMAPAYTLVVR